MASIESTFGNTRGSGDDLFLLNLLMTCLKVYKYPVYYECCTATAEVGQRSNDADGFTEFFEETVHVILLGSGFDHLFDGVFGLHLSLLLDYKADERDIVKVGRLNNCKISLAESLDHVESFVGAFLGFPDTVFEHPLSTFWGINAGSVAVLGLLESKGFLVEGTCGVGVACFLPVFIAWIFLLVLLFHLLFFFFLLLIIVVFLFLGLFGKIVKQIFIIGVGIHTEEVIRVALYFVFSESSYFNFIGIFSLFLLVTFLILFKLNSDGFRLSHSDAFFFGLRRIGKERVGMRHFWFIGHLLETVFMVFVASDVLCSLWFLCKFIFTAQVKPSTAHLSLPVLIRFFEGSGLSQLRWEITIQFRDASNSSLYRLFWNTQKPSSFGHFIGGWHLRLIVQHIDDILQFSVDVFLGVSVGHN